MSQGALSRDPLPRRSLLNWFLGTGVGAFMVSTLYPVTRFLIPPRVEESSAQSVALDVKAAELRSNTGRVFKFGKQPAILVRTPAGELHAFTAVCTHLQCTVQYREDLQHIWCACHNGHFDPVTGKNIGGPPPRPLEEYTVNVRGDRIAVSRSAPA